MSRSRKKAIYKDSWKGRTSFYWKTIRRKHNQLISQFYKKDRFGYWEFDDSLPDPKTIVNDYDYSDYTVNHEYNYNITDWWAREDKEKQKTLLRRK